MLGFTLLTCSVLCGACLSDSAKRYSGNDRFEVIWLYILGVRSHLGGGGALLVMNVAGERDFVSLCLVFVCLTSPLEILMGLFILLSILKQLSLQPLLEKRMTTWHTIDYYSSI